MINAVNSVSWAPHELGAILACASSDGKISVLTFKSAYLTFDRYTPAETTQTTVNGAPTSLKHTLLAATPYPGHPPHDPAH